MEERQATPALQEFPQLQRLAMFSPATQGLIADYLAYLSARHSTPSVGRVPAGCGYCFGTFPNLSERGQSAGDPHAKLVFKSPSTPFGLSLNTLSRSTPQSSTGILF